MRAVTHRHAAAAEPGGDHLGHDRQRRLGGLPTTQVEPDGTPQAGQLLARDARGEESGAPVGLGLATAHRADVPTAARAAP